MPDAELKNSGCCLAIPTESDELKQVAVYSESALFREIILQFLEIVAGEVDNRTTPGTD